MNNDAQRWKDKYLAGLEQQEALERRWGTRVDLLRRGLVRSSLAAEGADKAVDQCLQELREIPRRDDMECGSRGADAAEVFLERFGDGVGADAPYPSV